MNIKATEQRTAKVELAVLNALKGFGNFQKSKDEFSTYDLYGETGGEKTLIEIKERSKIWGEWYIEKAKIDRLIKLKNSADYKIRLYLFMVVNKDCFVYKVDEIAKCKVVNVLINNYTNENFKNGVKKSKRLLYCFPFKNYKMKLKL